MSDKRIFPRLECWVKQHYRRHRLRVNAEFDPCCAALACVVTDFYSRNGVVTSTTHQFYCVYHANSYINEMNTKADAKSRMVS